MLLKEIFDRDIYRDINPAVVVSDSKKVTIEAEIQEYVFTDELIEKLFVMLDTVLNKKSGKTGIWINGYYGSGKSHFIKYVHYLLNNETSSIAFDALIKGVEGYDNMKPGANDDINIVKLKLLQKRVASSHCDDIMFNVEDETDDGSEERLTRIFLNMFNKFRGYNPNDIPLAILLEKPLDQQGLLNGFKQKINSDLGYNWDTDAAKLASFQLQDVLEIAKSVYPSLDIVALHGKLANPEAFHVGIKSVLIPELQSFIKEKDKNYRLLFLVDEISQYVGSNKEILLNFQNIIERVSHDCNNQVWIACTAQQTFEEVSMGAEGVTDVNDEFGKILGRFDTRISLQSNDASYITQRRVLDKNSQGISVLNKMYDQNKDYIENQFKISHELYKGYRNEDEFVIGYPFIPYQFKLIAHVFEAFQQLRYVIKEVKDNERSVLGITHFTAKQNADREVGGFMPFDAFYNKQFHTNLTNRGSKAVQNGLEITYVKNNPFAKRVVKVLFMISNLLENQRQTFPSNIDNLTVLLMDKLDQNKKQLQKEIKEVLDKLVEESIIREDKGSYFFFNEDEMDVQNLIKSQTLVLDDRWSTFDEDFFRPMVRFNRKIKFGHNDFNIAYNIENKEVFRSGDFTLLVLLTDKTPLAQKALDVNKKDLVVGVNEWFNEDEQLRKDFDWYCKTNKYFINNGGGNTGERSKTNENFKIRNSQLKDRIEERLKLKFHETRFISQQAVIDSDQISGSNAVERLNNLIEKHLSGIYKNHKLSSDFASNTMELKRSAADNQILMPNLSPAETLVNDHININNNQITVYDLIQHFDKEPFGWRHEALIDVLVHLVKKKKREFVYKGQARYPIVDFVNKALSTAERMSCEIVTGEDIDQSILDNTVKAYKYIFNDNLTSSTDGNELFDYLQTALSKFRDKYLPLENTYFGNYPFGIHFRNAVIQINDWLGIRDPKKLFNDLIDGQIKTKDLFDDAKGMDDFIGRALREYDALGDFYKDNQENFSELPKIEHDKAEQIATFIKDEDPRKGFRHALKAKDELEKALNKLIADLQSSLKEHYTTVFENLESEAKKRDVDSGSYANKEYTINGIKELNSINSLKRKELEADNFKANELAKIVKATPIKEGNKVAESATYYVTAKASTISSEVELDAYLEKVRADMLEMIKNKKTIILK
jgi:hypothetical protein